MISREHRFVVRYQYQQQHQQQHEEDIILYSARNVSADHTDDHNNHHYFKELDPIAIAVSSLSSIFHSQHLVTYMYSKLETKRMESNSRG